MYDIKQKQIVRCGMIRKGVQEQELKIFKEGKILKYQFHKNGCYIDLGIFKCVGASHGNLPHVGITGDQLTLTQIGIQATARYTGFPW
jgi:hypothetical protein